jgi:hypothetical protein
MAGAGAGDAPGNDFTPVSYKAANALDILVVYGCSLIYTEDTNLTPGEASARGSTTRVSGSLRLSFCHANLLRGYVLASDRMGSLLANIGELEGEVVVSRGFLLFA